MLELRLDNISKSFGTNRVLRDLSLHHEEGILGISGPNGSGKSTLLRCLGGLLQPDSGSVEWRHSGNVLKQAALREILGYAAPYISLYRELSVMENLRFILRLRKTSVPETDIESLVRWTGLGEVEEKAYGKLSTGQQQRARLCSALVHRPQLLLLDEPGSNLDEEGRELVRRIADRYGGGENMLVIASNSPSEMALCDRVISLESD